MIELSKIKGIYLFTGKTDLRCGAFTLAQKVLAICPEEDMENKLFLFCSKTKKNLKILEWNFDGYWLYQKKLTSGKFVRPKDKNGSLMIDSRQLEWLLQGLSIEQKYAHPLVKK